MTTMLDSVNSNPTPSVAPTSSLRVTKRKLEDVIQSLDDALEPSDIEHQPSAKRARTNRSLYSTLAKYGIKTKDSRSNAPLKKIEALSKNTPHLTAILARAASHTRKALPFKFSGRASSNITAPDSTLEYRPSSIPSFLSRLATFKLATYANKPAPIDAVAASKCGWVNDGKDRLVCRICGVSWVAAGREGMNRDAANALIEKQRVSLVQMHKDGCPWKSKQCDPSIYRIPLQSPAAMARDIKANAVTLDTVLQGVEVQHPLTSTQIQSLRNAISSVTLPTSSISEEPQAWMPTQESGPLTSTFSRTEPLEASVLASLFGWAPAPPAPERSSVTRSNTRANSPFPSAPATPALARRSSLASPSIPVISSPRPLIRLPLAVSKRDTSLLHCILCQRRVGLWAFAPQPHATTTPATNAFFESSQPPTRSSQRQFDLLKEHRSYCPYVVRSATVPSLPVPPPAGGTSNNGHGRSSSLSQLNGQTGAPEGWRAVLTVVLRYGMGERQRMGLMRSSTEGSIEFETGSANNDGVGAMVAGVKSRGGKDLLKYVKSLLG